MVADKITGDKGPISRKGIRNSLAELGEAMRASGVSEEKIADVLRPGREIAYSKSLDQNERSDRFEAMYERLLEATQREMKVTMDITPEGSRYFQHINTPNQAYVSGGKNSQYTMPPPRIRNR